MDLCSSTNIKKITHDEFHNLKPGDIVFGKCGKHTFQCEVIQAPFYNYDADKPDWEVETTNGFYDEYSIYIMAK